MRKQVLALYGLIFVTVVVIVAVMWAPVTKIWIRNFVAMQLSTYMDTPVEFSDFQFGFFPPTVEFYKFKYQKESSPLEFVSTEKIRVEFGLSPSISGKIRIKNVEIVEPTLKFNFSKLKFEKRKKTEKKFKLPTLKDLLKVQIDQIQISKTALSFEFPGKYFLDVDSETAVYRKSDKSEYWTWNSSGIARKGKNIQKIDKVQISAKRTGQKIEIENLIIAGKSYLVSVRGQAYPDADMVAVLSGGTNNLVQVLNDMDVVKEKLALSGKFRIESRLVGPWENLNQNGKLSLENLSFHDRKIDNLEADFLVEKNFLRNVSGKLNANKTKLDFKLSEIDQNKKAKFSINSKQIDYADVQRAIDPTLIPILNSTLGLDAQGDLQIQPFSMQASYKVSSAGITFDLPEILTPYLPVQLKQIEIDGSLDWNMNDGAVIQGPLKLAGVPSGQYKINFPELAKVDGTWLFNVNRFGDLFTKDYPVVGKGKVTGFIKADHSDLEALFSFDINDLQFNNHEKSSLKCDLKFTDKGTDITNTQILTKNKRGAVQFLAHFAHQGFGETRVDAQSKDFDLAWISDMVSRRFPFVAGVQGRGSSILSLRGEGESLEGDIKFDSENFTWKDETLSSVSARLRLTPEGLKINDVKILGEDIKMTSQGELANSQYKNLAVHVSRAPVALVGLPYWLSRYISKVDGDVVLNGDVNDPDVFVSGKMYQPDLETGSHVNAGVFLAKGLSSNLKFEVDAFEKKFRSSGVLKFSDHTSIDASGKLDKFTILPQTNSFITGAWNFSGAFSEIKTWNGNVSIDKVEIKNSKLYYKSKSYLDLTIRDGIFNLPPFKLGDENTNVVIRGKTDENQNLFFTMKGKMPVSLFTLLPLKLTRADGAADVDLEWTGTIYEPELNGKIHAVNAYIQDQLFPHAIEDLEIQADVEQNRVKARFFKGKMSEGTIEGQGDLFLPTKTKDMRIFLSGKVDQVWLRFPEWLPALTSGSFVLDGDLVKPLLKGEFTILEGMYKDEWDWKKQILTIGSAARTARIYRKEDEGLEYDLSFHSNNGKFFLRNNLAKATMKGDIRIMGTNGNLGMLGQIEILDGEVVFLDRRFKLSPGTVNFISPNSVSMAFDMNAQTRIDTTYTDIFLELRTEQNQIRAYLSSNPVKDETTIISLLTFGVELTDLADTTGAQQGLSLSLLPTVLSGPVQSRVETGLRKIKLIDTFQFIPYFSEITRTSSMRLLVAKQLFSRSRLSYSTDMFATSAESIFAIEHMINNNAKILSSFRNDTLNSQQDLGLDMEFRFDF